MGRIGRLKYDNKIFDLFCYYDKLSFLEVKIVNGVEIYFYPEIRDFYHLNFMFNYVDSCVLNIDSKAKNNKFIFGGVVVGVGTILVSGVLVLSNNDYKLLPKAVLERTYYTMDAVKGLKYDIISHTDDLKKYSLDVVTFDELRKTLNSNEDIDDNYRFYCNLFIDTLEKQFPNIDLTLFNEHLKTLNIITVSVDEFSDEYVNGDYDTKKNIIRIKDGRQTNAEVIFHELIHCVRIGFLKLNDVELEIDYRIECYGQTFNEAFTELTANYLKLNMGHSYFDKTYRTYSAYGSYVSILYQILKLVEDEYMIEDFFNQDVNKLKNVLRKYGLEDLIILYDIDFKSSDIRDIVFDDDNQIKSLEMKLLSLRVEQELNKGTKIDDIYDISKVFYRYEEEELYAEITNAIKNYGEYGYVYLNRAKLEPFKLKGYEYVDLYSNPNINVFYNNNLVYSDTSYISLSEYLEYKLYIYVLVDEGLVKFGMCKLESDKYVDIITNELIDSTAIMHSLDRYINDIYDCNINLEIFLNSDYIKEKTYEISPELQEKQKVLKR